MRRNVGKRKRIIPVKGTNEDAGVYYKCWNCGFLCDSTRHPVGNGNGAHVGEFVEAHTGYETNSDGLDMIIIGRKHDDAVVTLRDNADTLTSYRHNHYPASTTGCPLCGSRNYR